MVRTSRRPFRGRALLGALTGLALAVSGLTVAGVTTATSAGASSGMLGDVNAARANAGRAPLAWNSHLAAVAGEQARRMAKQNRLYHNPNLASDVGNYRWVGENVGYGPSSTSIQKAFMKSAPHRANILDSDFTQIGIASVRDGDGRLWVAQVFRQPLSSSTPAKKKAPAPKAKPAAKKSTPKKKSAPSTTKRSTQSTSTKGNASAPKQTEKPKAPRTKPSQPTPEPTLEQRVSFATSQTPAPASDPLADALAFAATMSAVGG